MVVAGVLVWANCRLKSVTLLIGLQGELQWLEPNVHAQDVGHGWPIVFYTDSPPYYGTLIQFLIVDALVALAILAAVAVGCEWWVRRRE